MAVKDWLKAPPSNSAPGKTNEVKDINVRYDGKEYKAVFGPICGVEREDGSLWFSGKPAISLVDAKTGEMAIGLTIELPEATLGPNQVLVCGREEGPAALEAAGVVRCTGERIWAERYQSTVAVCELLVELPFVRPFAAIVREHEDPEKQKDGGREI